MRYSLSGEATGGREAQQHTGNDDQEGAKRHGDQFVFRGLVGADGLEVGVCFIETVGAGWTLVADGRAFFGRRVVPPGGTRGSQA
jgi:hypothetical protein